MLIATTVILLCSFGPGQCGDQPNAVRPQDVAIMHAFQRCVGHEMHVRYGMAQIENDCARRLKIHFELPASYHGPLVDVDTGRPITKVLAHAKPLAPSPFKPVSLAKHKADVLSEQLPRCFPALTYGLFHQAGEAYPRSSPPEPAIAYVSDTVFKSFKIVPKLPLDNSVVQPLSGNIVYRYNEHPMHHQEPIVTAIALEGGWPEFLTFFHSDSGQEATEVGFFEIDNGAFVSDVYGREARDIPRSAGQHVNGVSHLASKYKLERCGYTAILMGTPQLKYANADTIEDSQTTIFMVVDGKNRIVAKVQSWGV